jgi:glycosyltransferase involved in cell wall biosynthesis
VIVVDDASTDGTEEFIKQSWIDKIKYVRLTKNGGVQVASNAGFDLASGDYLAFIGDDDYWIDRSKLSKQVSVFENDPAGTIGVVSCSIYIERNNHRLLKRIKRPKQLVKHFLANNGTIYGSAALIRRNAFVLAGRFRESLKKGTDSDVYRRIFMAGFDLFIHDDAMIVYSETDPNRMTALSEKSIIATIEAINHILHLYGAYFTAYPSCASSRYFQIYKAHVDLYTLRGNKEILKTALRFCWRSFLTWPFNLVAVKHLIIHFLPIHSQRQIEVLSSRENKKR